MGSYITSIILVAGFSLGLASHAASVAIGHRANRAYRYLTALALLEAGYCILMVPYMSEVNSSRATPWILAICTFTPFITWVFGQLTLEFISGQGKKLRRFQRLNLIVCCVFTAGLLVDIGLGTSIVAITPVQTDILSLHRHLLGFSVFGETFLCFVLFAFGFFVFYLMRHSTGGLSEQLPILLGVILYFLTVISDFSVLFGLYDMYFMQHFGFFAVTLGYSLTFALRFGRTQRDLEAAHLSLEKSHQELVNMERVRTLALFSSGIAHEIRNPLSVISAKAQLLGVKRDLNIGQVKKWCGDIVENAVMIDKIIDGLLSLSNSRASADFCEESVAGLLQQVVEVCKGNLRKRRVEIRVERIDPELAVVCKRVQMIQVLTNLVSNACDAVENREDRWICLGAGYSKDSRFVWIDVVDSGPGIPEAVAAKIWTTFFTTKPDGVGTGLGLSLSMELVRENRGVLELDTDSPNTRFCLWLPAGGSNQLGSSVKQGHVLSLPVPESASMFP